MPGVTSRNQLIQKLFSRFGNLGCTMHACMTCDINVHVEISCMRLHSSDSTVSCMYNLVTNTDCDKMTIII